MLISHTPCTNPTSNIITVMCSLIAGPKCRHRIQVQTGLSKHRFNKLKKCQHKKKALKKNKNKKKSAAHPESNRLHRETRPNSTNGLTVWHTKTDPIRTTTTSYRWHREEERTRDRWTQCDNQTEEWKSRQGKQRSNQITHTTGDVKQKHRQQGKIIQETKSSKWKKPRY